MKTAWKIVWRVLLAIFLTLYVGVALLNYSIVQSVIGAEAGRRLSAEWGGEVKIGSLHIHPFNHLIANNLLMVAPNGDTIFDAETLRVHFKHFPYHGNRLELNRVYLKNAYYHFASYRRSDPDAPEYVRNMANPRRNVATNLQYIFNHYYKGPRKSKHSVFTVDVGEVVLNSVHYKMDLPDKRSVKYDYGVEIPHMEFYDIRGKISKIHVVNDDVTCRLVRLTTEERSGFVAKDIKGRVHVGSNDITVKDFKAETELSKVLADVEILYDGWDAMDAYLINVRHNIDIHKGTSVALSDAAYWAPVLWGIEMQLMPEGLVNGTVDRIRTDGFELNFGHASEIALEGSIDRLTEPDSIAVNLDQLDVRFEASDLTQVCAMLPKYITPEVAKYLKEIEYIDLQAQAHGSLLGEATANANLVCGLGNLRTDAKLEHIDGGRIVMLEANSDGLGLTPIGSDWLTHSGLELSARAHLPHNLKEIKKITGEAEMLLTNSVVKGHRINPVNLQATMSNGDVHLEMQSKDTLLDCDIACNMKLADSLRGYHAEININRLQADAFGLTKPELGDMAAHAIVNLKGNTLDEMNGGMSAHGIKAGTIKMNDLQLMVTGSEGSKQIRLESDALHANIGGRFNYADLPLMLQNVAYSVLPTDMQLVSIPDSAAIANIADNSMNFHLRWEDDGSLLKALSPNMRVARGTRIDGAYTGNDLLRLVARSDSIRVGSAVFNAVGLNSHYNDGSYRLVLECADIATGGPVAVDDIVATLTSGQEDADLRLVWGDSSDATHGDLWLGIEQGDISVLSPYFYIGESRWMLGIDSMHLTAIPHPALVGDGIKIESEQQHIDARLRMTHQDNDYVEMNFDNFDLGQLSDVLLQKSPVDVAGAINGRFSLYGLSATPYFNANLVVDSCIVNRQELGELTVRSNWNAEMNTLNLNVGGKTLHASGWLGLGSKDPELSFAVDFNQFELASVAPLLADFSSRFEGQLEGDLDISGTLSKPIVIGEAYINSGLIRLDMTGVTYRFNDSITFTNNHVSLNNFVILDPLSNIALLNGGISYNSLDNVNLDLKLNTDNLLVLNQKSGDEFYGTLLVQADAGIKGPINDLGIAVRARTNPGSSITVPVSDRRQVREQNYITFVGSNTEAETTNNRDKTSATDFNIEMDLAITPDVLLNLPMDFSEVAVNVKGSGNGDLHMTLDERLDPQVLGNYEITSGTLRLSLMSLIEKNFSLEAGSNMNFQGSLPDALFDLRAVYSQRVNLSTLTGNLSAVDNTQKYIQVEDIIAINGTIKEPTISFDLRLPNSDASVEEEVFAYIDRNSERDMLNQTMSLLLMGQFYNVGGSMSDNNSLLGNGLSSGYSMVASTMGSMVSDMVQIVDVDFKYKAATEMTNEQVDLNISKDWGRWYLESTLGYGGDSRELENNANGNAVIDALLGYRITPMIHVYAYNRTNNNDYTRIDLPYKQGAGLKLTKDFDRWGELFGKKSKRKGN